MKITVISDLHLECHPNLINFVNELNNSADLLVLAGDICYPSQLKVAMDTFCERFTKVIYVPGNHDYWTQSFDVIEALMSLVQKDHNNLYILDNDIAVVDGTRIIGTTMWFPDRPDNILYERMFVDFEKITNFRNEVYVKNEKSVDFLNTNVQREDIVVTHHLPVWQSVPEQWKGHQSNRFFVCDMSELILDRKPQIWIHGHTHNSFDYKAGNTRVICNPYGYFGYSMNEEFNPQFSVEV